MRSITAPGRPSSRRLTMAASLAIMIAVGAGATAWGQVAYTLDVTQPGGVIRMLVESPELVPVDDNWWYRPAGRVQLITGPSIPTGGNPTVSGDEDQTFCSRILTIDPDNDLYGFTSTTVFSINNSNPDPDVEWQGYIDIHELMAAASTEAYVGDLENYWIAPLAAGVRNVEGIARVPLDDNYDEETEFLEVFHEYTLIHDMLVLALTVYNPTDKEQYVGVRCLFDGTFGGLTGRDGQPVILPDGQMFDTEKVFPDPETGEGLPRRWVMYDNPTNPGLAVKGILDAFEITDPGLADSSAGAPDAIEFGTYNRLSWAGFDFEPASVAGFVGEDWAYANKWEEQRLAARHSRRYVSYFGLGVASADYDPPFALAGYGPVRLVQQAGDDPSTPAELEEFYLTDPEGRSPFPVSAYVDNFSPSPLLNPQVTIDLGDSGLVLWPSTQTYSKSLGIVSRNEMAGATWTLRAGPGAAGVAEIRFTMRGKEVVRKIYIPAIPVLDPEIDVNGLAMVSIPYEFTNTDAEHVFQSLGSLQPGGNAALIRWDPPSACYRWFPDPFVTNVVPGEGYWLLNRTGATINLPNDATPVNTDVPYVVNLRAGWNQIGGPFIVPQRFDSIRVIGPYANEWTMQEAIDRSLLLGTVFSYNPNSGDYEWVAELPEVMIDPYVGYWLLAYDDISLSSVAPLLLMPAGTASPRASTEPVSENNWRVELVTSVAAQRRAGRYFGVSPTAQDGTDKGDIPCPPAAMSGGVNLQAAFVRDTASPYVQDLHAPGSAKPWRFAVTTDAANERVSLSWPDLSAMPANLTVVLEDLSTGQRCFMRTVGSYSYSSGAAGGTREFSITVKPRTVASPMVTSAEVAQTGGGFEIAYTLSTQAAVDIEVRNISGVLIKRVVSGAISEAGTNTALWNGRSEAGTSIPSGRYLCKITARCPDTGQASNLVRTFEVMR